VSETLVTHLRGPRSHSTQQYFITFSINKYVLFITSVYIQEIYNMFTCIKIQCNFIVYFQADRYSWIPWITYLWIIVLSSVPWITLHVHLYPTFTLIMADRYSWIPRNTYLWIGLPITKFRIPHCHMYHQDSKLITSGIQICDQFIVVFTAVQLYCA
jgi:hypothetical protein